MPIFLNKSFADDQEKMIDFFVLKRKEFLKFYSYLNDEDYDATIQDILDRVGYWNSKYWLEDMEDRKEGTIIKDIVFGCMFTKLYSYKGD